MSDHDEPIKQFTAILGLRTEEGGSVTKAGSSVVIDNYSISVIREILTSPDGDTSHIFDAVVSASTWHDTSLALVASRLANGNRISDALRTRLCVEKKDKILA